MKLSPMPKAAARLGCGSVVKDTPAMRAKLSFIDRFDEPYTLYTEHYEGHLLIPRNIEVTCGQNTNHETGPKVDFTSQFVPRNSDQTRIINESVHLLQQGWSHLLQAATGFGKTWCAMDIIAKMGVRTAVVTTKEDIIDQWVEAAKKVLHLSADEIGVWRGDQIPDPKHKLVIGLVQSMSKGYERYGHQAYEGFPLLICDEVHRMGAEQFSQAMWWFNGAHRLGLSATPYRKDGRDAVFHAHIGETKVIGKVDTMVPRVLTKDTGWRVPRNASGNMIPHTPGKVGHIVKMMSSNLQRNLVLAEFIVAAHKKGRNTIVFSDSLDHLAALHAMCTDHGIPAADIGHYVGLQFYTGSKAERKAQREKAKVAKVIMATYKMASEATDIPWLDTCVLGTPRSDVIQIVGRIRREWENKKTPVVFDPVDSSSPVFKKYARSRFRWYDQIGAEVVHF